MRTRLSRSFRPAALLAGFIALVVTVAGPAGAYFGTVGSGIGTATTGTLNPATVVTGESNPGSGTVSLHWTPPTDGTEPQGYYVVRTRTSDEESAPACDSAPGDLVDDTDCVDSSVPDGTYEYTVVAVRGGWTARSVASAAVTVVNAVATTTTLQSSANPSRTGQAVIYTAAVVATGGTTPTGSVVFRDGEDPIACTGGRQTLDADGIATCRVVYPVEGTHQVSARYDGGARFLPSTSQALAQRVNLAHPTTTAELPAPATTDGWYGSDVTVTLKASPDGAPVASTQYSFDAGATWLTYTFPFVVSTPGVTTLSYRSTDAHGNVEPTSSTIVKIDKTAPTSVIESVSPAGNAAGWRTADTTITVKASDAGSGVARLEWRVGPSGPVNRIEGPGPYSIPVTSEGDQNVQFWAVDKVGNVEQPVTQNVKLDKSPPSLSIVFPNGNVSGNNVFRQGCNTAGNQTVNFDICGQVSDSSTPVTVVGFKLRKADNTCLVSMGSDQPQFTSAACDSVHIASLGSLAGFGWSAVVGPIPPGDYTLTVTATNAAGLVATETSQFTR